MHFMKIKCPKCGILGFINPNEMAERQLYSLHCCGAFIYRRGDEIQEPTNGVIGKQFGNDFGKLKEFMDQVDLQLCRLGMWG